MNANDNNFVALLVTIRTAGQEILLNNSNVDIISDGDTYVSCPFNFSVRQPEQPRENETAMMAMLRMKKNERPISITFYENVAQQIIKYGGAINFDITGIKLRVSVIFPDLKQLNVMQELDDFYDIVVLTEPHLKQVTISMRSHSYDKENGGDR